MATGTVDQVKAAYAKGEAILKALPDSSEADTQDHLIEPVLEALGYPKLNTRRHVADAGNYPDRIVWPVPVVEAETSGLAARFIIEEKPLGTDFDRPGASRADTPSRQIQRYLEQHRLANDATLGILTDGRLWRVYRRSTGPDRRVIVSRTAQYGLGEPKSAGRFPFVASDWTGGVQELFAHLSAETFIPDAPPQPLFPRARQFLADAISAIHNRAPAEVLEALCGQALERRNVNFPTTGLVADAIRHDWDSDFTFGLGPTYAPSGSGSSQSSLFGAPHIGLAAIPLIGISLVGEHYLRKGDIGLCARAFGRGEDPLFLCAYTKIRATATDKRPTLRMRLALHIDNQTSMTPEFDPDIPPTSVLMTIDKVVELLRGPEKRRNPAEFRKAFDIRPLQQDFYVRIERWLRARLVDNDTTRDMAMVRHLIRTLFAWILKEHGLIPRSLFDRDFVQHVLSRSDAEPIQYHDEVLCHLFHSALNVPLGKRASHQHAELQLLFDNTPFLNGSIFARHPSDGLVHLSDSDYWSDSTKSAHTFGCEGASRSGLYDVLSEFQWTLDEHSAQTNDQALDPELLGALFERLVSLVDHSRPTPRRKPKGTYYTPRDVVATMVTDALVARMLREDDLQVTDAELRQLFSGTDDNIPDWSDTVQRRVYENLRQLTVFDPAVGSGVFLLGMLETLMTAFSKLDTASAFRESRGTLVRAVIRDQLHGGDIQPLAAQIAKLRLFLAIEAAEGVQTAPLPNLEARIVNADALGTVPDPAWRPGAAEQLVETNREFQSLLGQIIANRSEWFDAHDPATKEQLLTRDRMLRNAISKEIDATTVSDRYSSFVQWAPLEHDDSVADTDPRLMFSRNSWSGFDIIIGNPPYGNLDQKVAKRIQSRGYRAAGARRIEAQFIELAMTLANPKRGIVELVLPLGVSFRQDHADLRVLVERQSQRVDIRHYDMTPGRIFNTEPTAKDWPNKQRAVLFTAWRGDGGQVNTTGLRRWFEMPTRHERAECLANRSMISALNISSASVDRRISRQWLRTPTLLTQELVSVLIRQHHTVGDLTATNSDSEFCLGLPFTAYQFVSALPAGMISPRREKRLFFKNREDYLLTLAALNGHVFYGWWQMTDDGFDVNVHVATTFGIPDVWFNQGSIRDSVVTLAERLVAAAPNCVVEKRNAKTLWRNVDFFVGAPDLVRDLDQLQLESLGLSVDPLMQDLYSMRSSSNWCLT